MSSQMRDQAREVEPGLERSAPSVKILPEGTASLSPLTVLGHFQGPSGRHWGATTPGICDAEDFHGLSLWPPFPVSAPRASEVGLKGES